MNPYLKALRLERWPRSTAILVGSTAFFWFHPYYLKSNLWQNIALIIIFAFLLTLGISTFNYVINEIADVTFDIYHPEKRKRPLARGQVEKNKLLIIGFCSGAISLGLGYYYFSFYFFLFLLSLLLAGIVYNVKPIRVKEIPFLDSIIESANNPIRFLIGWFAFTNVKDFPPISLLFLWWAFGNFLMVAKRLSEKRLLKEKAGLYRISLKKYSEESLFIFMIINVIAFFVFYFIFAINYKLQFFIYISPFILLYYLLFFRRTLKEEGIMEEPEQLLKNIKFGGYTLILVIIIIISMLIDKIGK